jgi:hypothetical protein
MKDRILTGWSAQRWLRLVFAVVFLVAGISGREPVAYVAAAFFGLQALLNVGCCGVSTCAPRVNEVATLKDAPQDVVYEEIT